MKQQWLGVVGGALVLAGVVYLHLFNPPLWSALANELLRTMHGPGFALVALAALWALNGKLSGATRYFAAAAVATTAGLIAEVAQIPGPRTAELGDLVINSLGIFSALGIAALADRQIRRNLALLQKFLLAVLCTAAASVAFLPTLLLGFAWAAQARSAPELLSFEHWWENATFNRDTGHMPILLRAPADWPGQGQTIARAEEFGQWGIFVVLRPPPNWDSYSRVRFVAASGSNSSFDIGVAIRDMRPGPDAPENLFYQTYRVDPQPRRYTITFDDIGRAADKRPFDFKHVEAIVFSAAAPGHSAVLLIDDIRLE